MASRGLAREGATTEAVDSARGDGQLFAAYAGRTSSSSRKLTIGVSMKPGQMTFARRPRRPYRSAIDLVSAFSACRAPLLASRSCGGSVVLVDEAAEPVAAPDLADGRSRFWLVRFGRPELKRAMRPLAVVVLHVDT